MVEQSSKAIASFMVEKKIIKLDDSEIYAYGIKHILINLAMFIIIGLIALISGLWLETLFFFIGFLPIRMSAGGYHSKTPQRCSYLSIIIYISNVFIIERLTDYMTFATVMILVIIIILSIYCFAPVDNKNRAYTKEQYHTLKKRSRIIVILLSIIILCLAWFGQLNATSCTGTSMGALTASISIVIGHFVRGGEIRNEKKVDN